MARDKAESLKGKYIAIEGPIGVGKTSLAEILARKLNARLVLEEVDENPFLDKFYRDMGSVAFQTQLWFLISRFRQQEQLRQSYLFRSTLVTDYIFHKDSVFANVVLDDEELRIYEKLNMMLSASVALPDRIVFLQATNDVLVERVKMRGRDFEREIDPEYLEEINKAYNYFIYHYHDSPALVVNTSNIDFVHSGADLDDLVDHLAALETGKEYYTPISK